MLSWSKPHTHVDLSRVGVHPCLSELSFCLRDVPSAPAAALCPGRRLGQLNLDKIRQKEDVVKIDIPSKVKLFLYQLITQNPSHWRFLWVWQITSGYVFSSVQVLEARFSVFSLNSQRDYLWWSSGAAEWHFYFLFYSFNGMLHVLTSLTSLSKQIRP